MPELIYIGTIHTPYKKIEDCPRNVQAGGPDCEIVVKTEYAAALDGLEKLDYIEVLYWLDQAKRDIYKQPRRGSIHPLLGTFTLRSPHRPNPIGSAVVKLIGVNANRVVVEGLDCLNETPLLDIKPVIGTTR